MCNTLRQSYIDVFLAVDILRDEDKLLVNFKAAIICVVTLTISIMSFCTHPLASLALFCELWLEINKPFLYFSTLHFKVSAAA